ncbi:Fumarate reductase flavoprotein subunit [Providencia rettgeri]|nr:Fumarate reductase flavoprotein subunit [Providencia rettgeri]
MTQLELWGCPWSRKPDGSVNVRRFGGMKIERTWFAADKTGFHMLHTLFQTSLKYPQIQRFDEHFVLDIIVDEGQVRGLVALNMMEGTKVQIRANAIVMATGGAGRVYRYNTNGGIVTGDGMGIAFRHGVPLRDMEFVQYHPTGLPGSGILMTEGCRGEGGILVNKDGYRYLQDYGMGPETPLGKPENKYMELGPRDKVSQAFWHEWRAGRTISTHRGDVVYLDLRHLGAEKLHERLPFICELAKAYVGVDPVTDPIPVRPTAHYTMGGIETDQRTETRIKGLFAVGECSSVGLHGANRLGSNSLAELVVFGRLAGEEAARHAAEATPANANAIEARTRDIEADLSKLMNQKGKESWSKIRDEMGISMEEGCGIYRTPELMQKTVDKIAELKERFKHVEITDHSSVFNTDLLYTIELGFGLDVAECMAHSAINRKESRGAHQRLDEGCTERDDVNFLKHTLAFYNPEGSPRLEYSDVKITKSQPAKRVYGAEAEAQDKAKKEQANG